ncbi:hypothetical protein MLD38_004707 [Melastoma candidum]|uniref:Uncharacterized protein n=1 Tax=Melastoma candidum TaxID=119954 RepID=A0ACB9S7U9_9MYRT|nr:hypothetical protein MLD38_004707 [Melastoma candidum]
MEGKGVEEGRCRGWLWMSMAGIFAVLVAAATVHSILTFVQFRSHKVHNHPGPINRQYALALQVAMRFFDVQKSGKLVNDVVSWRGDSGLSDGSEEGLDLSKGVYDAGDSIKFGFPMAYTGTIVSWAILEYGAQMKALNQLRYAKDSLRWITDYLINAHPSKDVLIIQVGDPDLDHNCWQRPEDMIERRPVVQVNTSFPGTEVAAETAAAMAAASLVFRNTDSAYSSLLLFHAQQLFAFADTYKGSYSTSIPQVQKYYNSSGFGDELLWAASWLYLASEDESYLRYVTVYHGQDYGGWGRPGWFSWDDKLPGVQVLLSRVELFNANSSRVSASENLALQLFRRTAEMTMCGLLPDSPTATTSRTAGGLIWLTQWNSLLQPTASAFFSVLYSDYMVSSGTPIIYCGGRSFEPADLRNFAISQVRLSGLKSEYYIKKSRPLFITPESSQVEYLLGHNPMKTSYLVGFGGNYPLYVHHRGASIPATATPGCRDGFEWLDSPDPNPNIATGALVGGPFLNDSYIDARNNSMQNEPTTYNTALLIGVLSGLVATSPGPKFFR